MNVLSTENNERKGKYRPKNNPRRLPSRILKLSTLLSSLKEYKRTKTVNRGRGQLRVGEVRLVVTVPWDETRDERNPRPLEGREKNVVVGVGACPSKKSRIIAPTKWSVKWEGLKVVDTLVK